MLPKNIILCPYTLHEELISRKYNKTIFPDRNCPPDRWYYVSKTGRLRTIIDDILYVSKVNDVEHYIYPYKRIR